MGAFSYNAQHQAFEEIYQYIDIQYIELWFTIMDKAVR